MMTNQSTKTAKIISIFPSSLSSLILFVSIFVVSILLITTSSSSTVDAQLCHVEFSDSVSESANSIIVSSGKFNLQRKIINDNHDNNSNRSIVSVSSSQIDLVWDSAFKIDRCSNIEEQEENNYEQSTTTSDIVAQLFRISIVETFFFLQNDTNSQTTSSTKETLFLSTTIPKRLHT